MEIALQLAKFHPETDLEILKLAVLFHDITYTTKETHLTDSAKTAEEFLTNHKYPEKKTKRVVEAILAHSTTYRNKNGEAKTIEGKILYDADKFRLTLNYDGYKKYYDLLYLEETKQLVNQVIRSKFGVK